MKQIPLGGKHGKGKFLIVDDEDYSYLKKLPLRYHVITSRGGRIQVIAVAYITHLILGNPPKGKVVDHVNGDTLDGRRANLRICTPSQNCRNRRKLSAHHTSSKYKGVHWHKLTKKWRAQIRVPEGPLKYLGIFGDEKAAGRAYDVAAKKYYGEFARLNF